MSEEKARYGERSLLKNLTWNQKNIIRCLLSEKVAELQGDRHETRDNKKYTEIVMLHALFEAEMKEAKKALWEALGKEEREL